MKERQKTVIVDHVLGYEPDPPLGEPYPGYSMMEMVKLEQQAAIEKAAKAYASYKKDKRNLKRTL